MQPDSITQVAAHALIGAGVPAPLAALVACLLLVVVPLLIGTVVVALVEHVQRRAAAKVPAPTRATASRPA